jgi:hypothetical protein
MYSDKGWTKKYKQLLNDIWKSIDISNYKDVHIINFESPY